MGRLVKNEKIKKPKKKKETPIHLSLTLNVEALSNSMEQVKEIEFRGGVQKYIFCYWHEHSTVGALL